MRTSAKRTAESGVDLRDAAHSTFVDQPAAFFNAVSVFLQ
jgi:hypothetical protein